jgi:hypothetical protein
MLSFIFLPPTTSPSTTGHLGKAKWAKNAILNVGRIHYLNKERFSLTVERNNQLQERRKSICPNKFPFLHHIQPDIVM